MSLNVFYFLHIDNKFIKLADFDEVLCKFFNVEVSTENYMTPEGNSVCWVDMLAGTLLELPGHIKTVDLDFDEIMDAVYHYHSMYVIDNVGSYIRCFNYARTLNIKINAHYADLSMFDTENRKHYRGLYDKEAWFSKDELFEYVKSVCNESLPSKTAEQIVYEMYTRRNE